MGVLCCTPSTKEKERWQLCYWEVLNRNMVHNPGNLWRTCRGRKNKSQTFKQPSGYNPPGADFKLKPQPLLLKEEDLTTPVSCCRVYSADGKALVLAHWIGLRGKKKETPQKTTWIILLEAFCNLWKATSAVRSLHSWENWEVSATSLDIYVSKGGFSGPRERHSWVSKQTLAANKQKSLFHSSKGFIHISKGKESSYNYQVPKVKSKRRGRRDIPSLSPGRIKPLSSGLLSCCHNAKPVLKPTGGQLGPPTWELPENFYSIRQILIETVIMSSHPFCSWITELDDLHEHL